MGRSRRRAALVQARRWRGQVGVGGAHVGAGLLQRALERQASLGVERVALVPLAAPEAALEDGDERRSCACQPCAGAVVVAGSCRYANAPRLRVGSQSAQLSSATRCAAAERCRARSTSVRPSSALRIALVRRGRAAAQVGLAARVERKVGAGRDPQRLLGARQPGHRVLELRLRGRELLVGPGLVEGVAHATQPPGVGVVVVGRRVRHRPPRHVDEPLLGDDGQVGARGGERDQPDDVLLAGPGHLRLVGGVRPLVPARRRQERDRERTGCRCWTSTGTAAPDVDLARRRPTGKGVVSARGRCGSRLPLAETNGRRGGADLGEDALGPGHLLARERRGDGLPARQRHGLVEVDGLMAGEGAAGIGRLGERRRGGEGEAEERAEAHGSRGQAGGGRRRPGAASGRSARGRCTARG